MNSLQITAINNALSYVAMVAHPMEEVDEQVKESYTNSMIDALRNTNIPTEIIDHFKSIVSLYGSNS